MNEGGIETKRLHVYPPEVTDKIADLPLADQLTVIDAFRNKIPDEILKANFDNKEFGDRLVMGILDTFSDTELAALQEKYKDGSYRIAHDLTNLIHEVIGTRELYHE